MKKIFAFAVAATLLVGCTKDITDLNKNPKAPEKVPAGTLFANSTIALVDYLASPNVNINNFRLWSQHWTQSTYTDESNFGIDGRDVNGSAFDILYATVLRDLQEARGAVTDDANTPAAIKVQQLATIDVLEVYTYSVLVDIFGDVPYSEAMGSDVTPVYDDAEAIYTDLVTRLSADIATLGGDNGWGESDLIYGGDSDKWKKFAASLALRMAIRVADHNPTAAAAIANQAQALVFSSSADDATLHYLASPPYTNPLFEDLVLSGRADFVASNTLGDIMNSNNDPRRSAYFRNLGNGDTVIGANYGEQSSYATHSQPGDVLEDPTFAATLIDYIEVEFLLADAARRGFISGSAAAHYDAAITASIEAWGGSASAAAAYLAQTGVAYSAANGKELIGTQKWVAMYDRGLEGWSTQRMYDYPAMNVAAEAGTVTPYRFNYGIDEYTLNQTNCEAAGAKVNGDDTFAKVFWDKN